jgi:ABC-type multidrug transport system fused ATPase/permease subunit
MIRSAGRRLPFSLVARQLRPFSPDTRRVVPLVVLITTIGGLAEAAALVLVARSALAITKGEPSVDMGTSIQPRLALMIALLALAIKLVCTAISARLSSTLSAATVRCGRQTLLKAFFSADWASQSEERLGELQDYLTSTVGRLNGVNQAFISGLNALVNFSILILAAVAVNPFAAIGGAVAAGLLLLLLRPLTARTRRYSAAESSATRALAAEVTQVVRLAQEVRVYGMKDEVLRRLGVIELAASTPLRQANFTSTLAPAIYQTVALAFLVVAIFAVDVVGDDQSGSLAAAVLLLLRGLAYGQSLQSAIQNLANTLPFLADLHSRKATYEGRAEESGTSTLTGIAPLEVRDVGFSYDGVTLALQGLNFAVQPHETLGIVGPSGGGKSTLLQLLLRLRRPSQGVVRYGDVDLWSVRADEWARRVAFVAQDARMLDTSVTDNITFFRDITFDQVVEAARLAHIHDEILTWSAGYQTRVGESGNRISGGQRQRIAIARALVGKPDILVLDEPTSALDLLSEAKLQQTLAGLTGKVTLIIVAHRLSTVQHCNRILVLKDGCQEAFDLKDQLLQSSAFYRDAVSLSVLPTTETDG